MYGIFTYIYHKNQPNVGKSTIFPWILWVRTTCQPRVICDVPSSMAKSTEPKGAPKAPATPAAAPAATRSRTSWRSGRNSKKKQWPVDSSSCMVYFTPVYISLRIQPPSQTVIGVYNHLLRKVFRFHYHSQKVIRSLGNIYIYIQGMKIDEILPSWIWTIICYHKDFVMNQSVFDGSCHQGRVLQSWGRQAVG